MDDLQPSVYKIKSRGGKDTAIPGRFLPFWWWTVVRRGNMTGLPLCSPIGDKL